MNRKSTAAATAALTLALAAAGTALAPQADAATKLCDISAIAANPYTGSVDSHYGLHTGIEQSQTASGRYQFRFAAGNAIFYVDNDNNTGHNGSDGANGSYFTNGFWGDVGTAAPSGGQWYAFHNWQGNWDDTYYLAIPVKSVGVKVNTDGSVAGPWSSYKYSSSAWGFRQNIETYASEHIAEYRITVYANKFVPGTQRRPYIVEDFVIAHTTGGATICPIIYLHDDDYHPQGT